MSLAYTGMDSAPVFVSGTLMPAAKAETILTRINTIEPNPKNLREKGILIFLFFS